ncbi:MAG: energy-coupling factor ABC transporter ATP-binding protein [Lachnospiraceae bacterium]
MAHFEIKNLSFSYPMAGGRKALDNINLTIERGQYVTFCGRSGCGKTTLLRQLKSAITPHGKRTGEILFDGTPIGNVGLREQSARIGYVMQDPDNQIVTDKVWHELAFGLESLGVDQKTIRLRVAEMASYFGIQGWFHKKVTELSGGQKQLLNLASIMAMQPDVLILDEPTSQLDPIAASDFLNTVRKINRELRTTVLITEHRLEDIFHALGSGGRYGGRQSAHGRWPTAGRGIFKGEGQSDFYGDAVAGADILRSGWGVGKFDRKLPEGICRYLPSDRARRRSMAGHPF